MLSAFVLALSVQAAAAAPVPAAELVPGTTYDPAIPTTREVLGYAVGERIAPPEDLVVYLQALAKAAPDRTRLVEYARSWEGRPLVALIVAAPERIARLDDVQRGLRRLADPRTLAPGEDARLVADLPVVVALVHGVHGNEISPGGAAMAMAHHLLAARNDPAADLIRREAIVLIDPTQNPDGRARFVASNAQGRAAAPDPLPFSAEHDEPWPGGRSNHYLFDLNRDWFAQTQPESAGRVKLLLDWSPQVVVDLHEMGGDSSYYFPPAAEPGNPHTTAAQKALYDVFGRAMAARFDARGFPFFTGEVFDAFYPGYGVSWPTAQGAIGMTFEMASARGLVYRRTDGTRLTYEDGILEHFTAALATAETAARHRERMLREYVEFRRSAIRDGETGTREYVLTSGDAGQTERLARLLVRNGIEVRRAREAVVAGGRTVPAGAFLVSLAQPAGRLARNLLDAQTSMNAAFVKRQNERRAMRLPDQIYDVTAWSLPLLWDIDALAATTPIGAGSEPYTPGAAPAAPDLPEAKVGYLLPWNATTAGAIADALGAGLKVRFSPGTFTLAGRSFERGTAILRVSDNPDRLRDRLVAIAGRHGATVVPIDTAFVESGISLGSGQVRVMKAPRVLLAWDAPASSLSAGWARYVLERRYGVAVTAVRVASFGRVPLDEFDVVVLPSGTYSPALGAEATRRLKEWMTRGGTLITVAEASRWAAREAVGLLASRTELRGGAPEGDAPPKPRGDAPKQPFDLDTAIQPPQERPDPVPGAILRVSLDTEHWLAAGTDGGIQAQVESQRIFTPITLDKGRNVGTYAKADRLLASGILWPGSGEPLAQKAFLVHQPMGEGHLIAFAEDPNARAFAESTMLLFVNAVLLGPAF